jgi:hypothetical protein
MLDDGLLTKNIKKYLLELDEVVLYNECISEINKIISDYKLPFKNV